MKILYGVAGEGFGHAARSRTIIRHLAASHDVLIVASARAYEYLSGFFPDVVDIEGLRFVYEGNEIDPIATVWDLVDRLPQMVSHNLDRFLELSGSFTPDVVISDFDSFAYLFGKHHDVPVLSIDNLHVLTRCTLDVDIPPRYEEDYWVARQFVASKLPDCSHYMVTTFFFPEVCEERTSLWPPVLRPEVVNAARTEGEHVLVYHSAADEEVLGVLMEAGVPCRVYGFGVEEKHGALQLREFSDTRFIEDLASCRAVVATGGFSLMSEAIFLGKPYLALPIGGQFEQVLNSLYLQKLGYGEYGDRLTPQSLAGFLSRVDAHAARLETYGQEGNTKILRALDGLLARMQGGGGPADGDDLAADIVESFFGELEDLADLLSDDADRP
ncbi:MAG: MJ1255/VC2487 family glycosyltransferase [Verrucomicrobiota bacterium]